MFSEDLPIDQTNVSFILSRPLSQHASASARDAKAANPRPLMWADETIASCGLTDSPLPAPCSCCPPKPWRGAKEKLAALDPSGLVLVMDEKGNELVVQNADKPFVPASVAKIVTAWLAMELLGADYRFRPASTWTATGCSTLAVATIRF